MDLTHYLADAPPTIVPLTIKSHWDALSAGRKAYAHHLSRAAFYGTRIVLRQVSPESEDIYDLIIALHNHCNGQWEDLAQRAKVSPKDLKYFLEYAAQFLGNLGNYKGFGDTKFIPRCSKSTFEALAAADSKAQALCKRCIEFIYADQSKPSLLHLGFPEKGHMTNYYPESPQITQEEIAEVDKLLGGKGLLPENTRIRKLQNGDFEVLIASAISNPPAADIDVDDTTWQLPSTDKSVRLVFGDHQEEMAKIALHMKQASKYADNETQARMTEAYAKSFATGSLNAFKESQMLWVKDIGPAVETNIGFIENYRDPAGVRSEWEGMVAMINQERTAAFKKLVDAAPSMIPKLPWSAAFEKNVFTPPDFTSLEVLSFPGSGIPAGINIPNYDDIRQNYGFKNVSLGNVLSAKGQNEPVYFIRPEDIEIYKTNRDAAFEVQVGVHELLGHGTGKLLQETSPGIYNFDKANPPLSPITGKPVTTFYKPGETWSSVFAAMSSSYEECRAECVAMALSCDFAILRIFGLDDSVKGQSRDNTSDQHRLMHSPAGDVLYASYLSMAHAGLRALEFWDPKSGKWGQAHMQARFSILQVFLRAGDGFCSIEEATIGTQSDQANEIEESSFAIHLDRSKILTHGRPAVESYLQKLHVYKCTADISAGTELYETITSVSGAQGGSAHDGFWTRTLRDEVLRRKVPRKVFVQSSTVMDEGKDNDKSSLPVVRLLEYESTEPGMIRSWAERRL